MGRKRNGTRNQIYLYCAILIYLSPAACTLGGLERAMPRNGITRDNISMAKEHLDRGETLLAQGDFEKALQENEKAIALAGIRAPADQALFTIGLIYAHPSNSARNYDKSLSSFKKLAKDYPKSPNAAKARIIISLLQENDRIEKENDKLNRNIERLNNVIDELKAIDVRVEQKKREKAK